MEQKIPIFLVECRRCGEQKQPCDMVQLRGNPTKICKLCSRIVYRERKQKDYIPPPRKKRKDTYYTKNPLPTTYTDMIKDSQGYIRDLSYKPSAYELVDLKLEGGRNLPGWWTGREWFGRMLKPNHVVIGWKRKIGIRMA